LALFLVFVLTMKYLLLIGFLINYFDVRHTYMIASSFCNLLFIFFSTHSPFNWTSTSCNINFGKKPNDMIITHCLDIWHVAFSIDIYSCKSRLLESSCNTRHIGIKPQNSQQLPLHWLSLGVKFIWYNRNIISFLIVMKEYLSVNVAWKW
jgi:hypothetical protein